MYKKIQDDNILRWNIPMIREKPAKQIEKQTENGAL